MEVVGHVADEKERRRRQRAEHAPLMLTPTPLLDEQIPGDEKDRRDAVQRGIQGGQIGDREHVNVLGLNAREFGSKPQSICDECSEQQRQISDREEEQLTRGLVRTIASEYDAQPDENDAEARGHGTVRRSRKTDKGRQQADGPERRRVEKCLPSRSPSIRFYDRQQRNACVPIVVLVHPRDGEEVRHLPEEDDAEEDDCWQGDVARCGSPADHWWQRTRYRADDRGE